MKLQKRLLRNVFTVTSYKAYTPHFADVLILFKMWWCWKNDMSSKSILNRNFNTTTYHLKWRMHTISSTLPSSTGWWKCHATHIKIFTARCNSMQFDWINKHTISPWLYKSPCWSRHVITCSGQFAAVFGVKDVFLTGVTSVHCRKLPGISFLLGLTEWV
jgi:hypothetical protein